MLPSRHPTAVRDKIKSKTLSLVFSNHQVLASLIYKFPVSSMHIPPPPHTHSRIPQAALPLFMLCLLSALCLPPLPELVHLKRPFLEALPGNQSVAYVNVICLLVFIQQ